MCTIQYRNIFIYKDVYIYIEIDTHSEWCIICKYICIYMYIYMCVCVYIDWLVTIAYVDTQRNWATLKHNALSEIYLDITLRMYTYILTTDKMTNLLTVCTANWSHWWHNITFIKSKIILHNRCQNMELTSTNHPQPTVLTGSVHTVSPRNAHLYWYTRFRMNDRIDGAILIFFVKSIQI